MRVTINGKVTKDIINSILNEQQEKIKAIKNYCKNEKIAKLSYKDAELEYEYIENKKVVIKDTKPKKGVVEKR